MSITCERARGALDYALAHDPCLSGREMLKHLVEEIAQFDPYCVFRIRSNPRVDCAKTRLNVQKTGSILPIDITRFAVLLAVVQIFSKLIINVS